MALVFKHKIIVLLWLIFLSYCMYYYPTDWMGWFIFGGSFYFIDKMNLGSKVKGTLLFILSIHQLIALYYFSSYHGYIEGVDFTAFHVSAENVAHSNFYSFGTDAALFSNLLALFYKLDNSLLFGEEIAVVAFMSSCFIFMRIIRYYKFNQYLIPILLLYALGPASLLWTSIVLREPFEIMFLMLAFEGLIYSKSANSTISIRLVFLGCAFILVFLMGLLHKGLFVCLPAFIIIFLVLPARDGISVEMPSGIINLKKMTRYLFFILLPFILLIAAPHIYDKHVASAKHTIIYSDNNLTGGLLYRLSSDGIYKTLVNYRYGDLSKINSGPLNANTNYDKGDLIPNNLGQFIYMSLHEYANYAFLPALLVTGKWSLMNLVLSLIYIARFMLFCSTLVFCVTLYKSKVRSPMILLSLYLVVGYVLSLGTTSYGTAMRHNAMTDWIIILLGTPLIYDFSRNLLEKIIQKGSQLKIRYSVAGG